MLNPLNQALEKLIEALDGSSIDYMLMGGLAVRHWAIPRATFDIDITLCMTAEAVASLLKHLEDEGFTIPEQHSKGAMDYLKGMKKFRIQLFIGNTAVDIDCFMVTSEYQEAAFQRRMKVKHNDVDVWMISIEDLILHKLFAGRRKDLADIESILVLEPMIDRNYLDSWATKLSLSDKLAEFLH